VQVLARTGAVAAVFGVLFLIRLDAPLFAARSLFAPAFISALVFAGSIDRLVGESRDFFVSVLELGLFFASLLRAPAAPAPSTSSGFIVRFFRIGSIHRCFTATNLDGLNFLAA
jgi:hypothetical protein